MSMKLVSIFNHPLWEMSGPKNVLSQDLYYLMLSYLGSSQLLELEEVFPPYVFHNKLDVSGSEELPPYVFHNVSRTIPHLTSLLNQAWESLCLNNHQIVQYLRTDYLDRLKTLVLVTSLPAISVYRQSELCRAVLSRCTGLSHLTFHRWGGYNITDLFFCLPSNLQSLTFSQIWSRSFSTLQGLSHLVSLTSLDVNICFACTDLTGIAALTRLRKLRFFNPHYLRGYAHLSQLRNLEDLSISIRDTLDFLIPLTNLTHLSLKGCKGLHNFMPLRFLKRLVKLEVSDLDDTQVVALQRATSSLKLQTLVLDGTEITTSIPTTPVDAGTYKI